MDSSTSIKLARICQTKTTLEAERCEILTPWILIDQTSKNLYCTYPILQTICWDGTWWEVCVVQISNRKMSWCIAFYAANAAAEVGPLRTELDGTWLRRSINLSWYLGEQRMLNKQRTYMDFTKRTGVLQLPKLVWRNRWLVDEAGKEISDEYSLWKICGTSGWQIAHCFLQLCHQTPIISCLYHSQHLTVNLEIRDRNVHFKYIQLQR